MSECPFCKPRPEQIVLTTALTYAIHDANPASPGHMLIISKRHVSSFFEANPEEQREMLETLGIARARLDEERHPDGYNLGVNVGEAAGQTVPHLHIHLIPRFVGDCEDPRGGIRHCIPAKGYYPIGS